MIQSLKRNRGRRGRRQILRRRGATVAIAALLPALLCTGCGDDLEREFRSAAIGGIETGVNSIVGGLLDGLFAVADPANGDASQSGG